MFPRLAPWATSLSPLTGLINLSPLTGLINLSPLTGLALIGDYIELTLSYQD